MNEANSKTEVLSCGGRTYNEGKTEATSVNYSLPEHYLRKGKFEGEDLKMSSNLWKSPKTSSELKVNDF